MHSSCAHLVYAHLHYFHHDSVYQLHVHVHIPDPYLFHVSLQLSYVYLLDFEWVKFMCKCIVFLTWVDPQDCHGWGLVDLDIICVVYSQYQAYIIHSHMYVHACTHVYTLAHTHIHITGLCTYTHTHTHYPLLHTHAHKIFCIILHRIVDCTWSWCQLDLRLCCRNLYH